MPGMRKTVYNTQGLKAISATLIETLNTPQVDARQAVCALIFPKHFGHAHRIRPRSQSLLA